MRIFLRVLVVLLLVLSGLALALSIHLFNQREVIKGRALRFEEFALKLAPTLESDVVKDKQEPEYTPPKGAETYEFWQKYLDAGGVNIEAQDVPKFSLDANDLKTYYFRDPAFPTEDWKDPDLHTKTTKGAKTLDNALTNTLALAIAQLAHLNDTRFWLQQMREELDTTIKKHNVLFDELETAKAKIVTLEAKITELNGQIEQKEKQIKDLEAKTEELENRVRDQQEQITTITEERDTAKQEFSLLNTRYQDLLKKVGPTGPGPGPDEPKPEAVTSGAKGKIVFVDAAAYFAIIAITADSDLSANVELTALRNGHAETDSATGKLRVREVLKEQGKAIVDILNNWQLQVGDDVIK
jgi:hypothetical protein